MANIWERLGDNAVGVLVNAGVVKEEDLEPVLSARKDLTGSIGENIIRTGLVDERVAYEAAARHLKVGLFDPDSDFADPHAREDIDGAFMVEHQCVPLRRTAAELTVAMSDPTDIVALDQLRSLTGLRVVPLLARPRDLQALVKGSKRKTQLDFATAHELVTGDEARAVESPVIRFVDAVLAQAMRDGASDIHFEPMEKEFIVRYRIDGLLHDVLKQKKAVNYEPVISRLKLMGEMDIAERRLPQDGHLSVRTRGKTYDLRLSTMPTVFGEKMVIRVLDKSSLTVGFDQLGIAPALQAELRWAITRPTGLLLVTGPTGSGKTTTLYSFIQEAFDPTRNFITVEDPVEFLFPRLNQVQVNERAGLTFANALRFFLRQDPDVILVGEVRDGETARLAIEAGLTGHLVMTTLHTNDAAAAGVRLIEMGVEPFLIAGSLLGIVAQRLVRRVCTHCAEEYLPDASALERIQFPNPEEAQFLRGVGCDHCRNTGYRGRVGIFEFMRFSRPLRDRLAASCTVAQLRDAAIGEGMTTIMEDGYEKVRVGLTTIEEVLRVVEALE